MQHPQIKNLTECTKSVQHEFGLGAARVQHKSGGGGLLLSKDQHSEKSDCEGEQTRCQLSAIVF